VSLNLSWSSDTAPRTPRTRHPQDHLRIKDLVRNIERAELPQRQSRQVIAQGGALRQSYDLSLRNIDDNIYAMASATAALDRVEGTLIQAKAQIEQLCNRGEPVDLDKVERTLMALAEHINQSVRRADDNYVNLLRDSRLQMIISEAGSNEQRSMKVDLTLISLDKLIAWKLRDGPDDPEAWIDLIDAMGKVVLQNVQILSSLILTLFAARDYTTGVVEMVTNPMPDRRTGSATSIATDFVHSARTALLRDESTSRAPQPQLKHASNALERRQPPSRLMAFLNQVTFQN
jgi:hypothetical protein